MAALGTSTARQPQRVGEIVLLLPPVVEERLQDISSNPNDPTLIIIFGWLGAQMPHLLKYTQAYTLLYPRATQILVRSPPSFFFKSERSKRSLLNPVIDALKAFGYYGSSDGNSTVSRGILIHAFSNSGAYALATLSQALAPSATPAAHIPCALVLDSTPGRSTRRIAVRAYTIQIQPALLRYLAIAFFSCLYYVMAFIEVVLRTEPPIEFARRVLGSPAFLPWTDVATPRLYVYSNVDELVPSDAVENHADEAEASGVSVHRLPFEGTAHVAHMRSDPDRYWGAIKQLWKKAGEGRSP
ncbi:DUF829-domain-containing protein [Auriscalpium vulgare]|uniref:DUF829-domain-containing protein n=1 Tax=Auriscalpium vulgare TaxID=40419 RepID=A0ACB8RKN4_9AGAM|nr:DUF829-domain-containing protein [Auriscalpium vulgare]